ncbi:hypothetical protein D3C80_1237820 [compost metagenome]
MEGISIKNLLFSATRSVHSPSWFQSDSAHRPTVLYIHYTDPTRHPKYAKEQHCKDKVFIGISTDGATERITRDPLDFLDRVLTHFVVH